MRPKRGPPIEIHISEAQEGSPPQVTRSLFFKAPGHQVTFFHEKIKTTQVTGRFFKLSRSRGRPQNGPRSQVAKKPLLGLISLWAPPPQVTRSLFFKAPGHQVTFFHEKIKTTQVTGRFFKLSRSRGRPQNGPRSQVAKTPSWASPMRTPLPKPKPSQLNQSPLIPGHLGQTLLSDMTFYCRKNNPN